MTTPTLAIQVRDLRKSFRVPDSRPPGRGERLLRPARRRRPEVLEALKGISFEVGRGEFMGVLGRNGSGKSTLLRLLASIYMPDSGSIRVRGRVAPFIELGIGFDRELSARENVVLNGVMLGLTPSQARSRLDSVIEFAELRDFADMKLKNFSTGMRVRLAFAVMVEADPDVFLIDEILAVGDAAFRERCSDVFRELRSRGKTIVLVTHQVAMVERECDRALLLEEGRVERSGEPGPVVQRYFDFNLEQPEEPGVSTVVPDPEDRPAKRRSRISDLRLVDHETGVRVGTVEERAPIEIGAEVVALKRVSLAGLRLELRTQRGARLFMSADPQPGIQGSALAPGESARIRARLDNPLPPGRYTLRCTALQVVDDRVAIASLARAMTFDVGGERRPGIGLVSLDYEVNIETSTVPSRGL